MLLQAGYRFDEYMDQDEAEVYGLNYNRLTEWFRKSKIPHALVSIDIYEESWLGLRFVVAADKDWLKVRVRFPFLKTVESTLEQLMEEPQTAAFGWSVEFVGV